MARKHRPHDAHWKEALRRYFRPALELFFPAIASQIDWSRLTDADFLDKELEQALGQPDSHPKRIDLLVRVYRLDGSECWVLLHVEVQGQRLEIFAERQLVYYHSLSHHWRRPICSLAILADGDRSWRPDRHATELWGCRCELQFPTVKLLDYPTEELERSNNPFALIVAAHLHDLPRRRAWERRRGSKFRLVRNLYDRGLARGEIRELFGFIDRFLYLPPMHQETFRADVTRLEEEKHMEILSTFEEAALEKGREEGREKGREEGRKEGLRQSLVAVLESRFGSIAVGIRQRIEAVREPGELANLTSQAATANSLEEFLPALP